MSRRSGQAIVEAALVLPIVLLLGLGVVALARLADATEGVEAATAAAASAAARAPSLATAQAAGATAFRSAVAGYGLARPAVSIDAGDFERGGRVIAHGSAGVDLTFAGIPALPRSVLVRASATAPIESWRSR